MLGKGKNIVPHLRPPCPFSAVKASGRRTTKRNNVLWSSWRNQPISSTAHSCAQSPHAGLRASSFPWFTEPQCAETAGSSHSSPTVTLRRAELKSDFVDGVRCRRTSGLPKARESGGQVWIVPRSPACLTLQLEVSWALLCFPKLISHFPPPLSPFQRLRFFGFQEKT